MSRRLLIALALAGVAAATTAVVLVLVAHDFNPESDKSVGAIALDGVFIAAGLIAWYRVLGNIVGALLTVLGFVEIAAVLYWDAALPFTMAMVVAAFVIPLFVHVFLVFPDGLLATRFDRSLVWFVYAAAILLRPVTMMFWDSRADDCPDCPANLLLVSRNKAVAEVLVAVATLVVVTALVAVAVRLVQRVRRSRGPARLALAPVLAVGAVEIALLAGAELAGGLGATTTETVLYEISGTGFFALPILCLVGVLRTRLRRSTVADLVIELGSLRRPAEVRDAIALTLDDNSPQLAFWLPDRGHYVDPDGEMLDPQADAGRAVTVIEHDGMRLAALVHDRALLDDAALVEAVGAAAGMALENARLQAELRAQLTEVRASRIRLVQAGDAERRRLERDLHDGAQQRLLGLRLALQLARSRLADGGRAVDELLAEADSEVVGALDELRALARGIHPALLTDEGLSPALAALARRVPVPVDLNVCAERLPPTVEATAYFVASEALANVVKHARATRATIEVIRRNRALAIEVTDDGIGGADVGGAGLRGLGDRVEALDGHLSVASAPMSGTRLTAAIPCG